MFLSFQSSKSQVSFIATDECYGSYTTLVAQHPGINTSDILYWYWFFNNENDTIISYGDTLHYLFKAEGVYPVRLKIITASESYNMLQPLNVYVRPLPNANFTVNNACQGSNTIFSSTSVISQGYIKQFKWDFNNDGFIDYVDSLPNSVSFNFGAAGNYITKLEVVSDYGCVGITTKSVQIFPTPDVAFSYQNTCAGDMTQFTNHTIGGSVDYCIWDFGDGQSNVSNGNVTHQYNSGGNYNVRLIAVTNNNCRDTFSLNIPIYPQPNVNISFSNNNNNINEGGTIDVTANGDFTSLLWSTGQTTNPITLSQGGNYTVTVTNSFGCTNATSFNINMNMYNMTTGQPVIESNTLTLNGDGINEMFIIQNIATFSKCKLSVYNIYGDRIYVSDYVYSNSWNGNDLDEGAYYYILDTDKGIFKGCINILR